MTSFCQYLSSDYESNILLPGNYGDSSFDNNDIPFGLLKSKNLSDYDVALKYLNKQYCLSDVEYKLYHPNLLRNDIFIKHYQKNHCDFDVVKPKNTLTRKTNKYTHKK